MSIHIHCNGTTIRCVRSEVLTVGMIGAPVQFTFSEEWDGLDKTAVFTGSESRDVIVDGNGTAVVPWEILAVPGLDVEVGVYAGRDDGTTWPAPTPMCKIGTVLDGADPDVDDSYPPTPDVGGQAVAAVAAALQAAEDVKRMAANGEFDGPVGPQGPAYELTSEDKAELVAAVIAQLPVYDGEAVDV